MKFSLIFVTFENTQESISHLGLSREEEFKCYSCNYLFDDFCSDPDALIAKGSEAIRNCEHNENNQCLYQRGSKYNHVYNFEVS